MDSLGAETHVQTGACHDICSINFLAGGSPFELHGDGSALWRPHRSALSQKRLRRWVRAIIKKTDYVSQAVYLISLLYTAQRRILSARMFFLPGHVLIRLASPQTAETTSAGLLAGFGVGLLFRKSCVRVLAWD